ADGGNAGVGAVAEPPRRLLQPLQEQVKTERAAKPGKWARIITSARLRRIYASTRPFLHNQDPSRTFGRRPGVRLINPAMVGEQAQWYPSMPRRSLQSRSSLTAATTGSVNRM